MTNTIGKIFSITSFGSSHGKALGAVVDGCPANLELSEEDIQIELNKRRPGTSALTTSRNEGDKTGGATMAGITGLPHGAIASVAEELGGSRSLVEKVANGERKNDS